MRFTVKKSILSFVTSIALITSLSFGATLAFATPAEEKQAEADAAFAQLQEKQSEFDAAEQAFEAAEQARIDAEAAVADATARIEAATERITKLQGEMGTRARSMYRSGSLGVVDLLFGAATFDEFVNNWDFLNILNQNDADMISETKTLRTEIEAQKVVLVEQQAIATQKAKEAQEAVEAANEVVEEMRGIYESLSEEAAELLAQEQAAAAAAAAAAAQNAIQNGGNGGGGNGGGGNYNNDYSGRADAGSTVGRAYAIMNEGDCYYSWGGVGPYGFDCSGFVSYCLTGSYSRLGTTYTFLGWNEVSDPQPGDVCVNAGHTGIYIGGGQMIHAASPSEGIIVGPVQSGMIYVRY